MNMKIRNIILTVTLLAFCGVLLAQEKEPGMNEFIFVDQEPQPLNVNELRKEIGYPQEAIDKNIEGTVVARILVDKEGNYVKHSIVNEIDPLLAGAVEPQLSRLKFKPAMIKDEPVLYWVNMPFPFKLLGNDDVIKQNIDKLTDELTADPENYEVWHRRGIQRSTINEYEDALADFNEAIRLNPKKNKKKAKKNTYAYLFYSYYGRATVYFGQEKFEDAIADFNQALTFAEEMAIEDSGVTANIPNIHLERGFTYAKIEKFAEAKADFKKAMALDKEQKCTIYPLLVDIGLSEDNSEELVEYYSGMLECEPDDELNLFSRGYYKSESGDYEGAIEDLAAIEGKTKNLNIRIAAINGIGIAHMRDGDLEKAREEFERAINVNVLNPMPHYHMGQLAEKMGDKELACESYKKAVTYGIEGQEMETGIAFMKENCGWEEDN